MNRIHTTGHSTRSLEDLLALLQEFGIQALVDVRRFPASRRHPHFARENLVKALKAAGLVYHHEADLGGFRTPLPDSPNTAWRQAGFRGYADYMGSPEFRQALHRLMELARKLPTVLLCAEAVPWRCHRQLIADALVVRGFEMVHILGPGQTKIHSLHPNARMGEDDLLTYPATPPSQGLLPGIAGASESRNAAARSDPKS